eukprot:4497471-Alexandrium_andersonii.AAC.1
MDNAPHVVAGAVEAARARLAPDEAEAPKRRGVEGLPSRWRRPRQTPHELGTHAGLGFRG